MKVLNLTISVIKNIVNDNEDFYKVLRKTFDAKDITKEEKKTVTAFAGCILRHYLCFKDLLNRNFKDIDEDFKIVIMFMLANVSFLRRLSEDEWVSKLNTYIKENELDVDNDLIFNFIKSKVDGNTLIDDTIEKTSHYYCSLRFNLPIFLTKMWSRTFSKKLTYKIAKSITKNPRQLVKVNTLKISNIDFENKFGKDFIKSEYDGLYEYIGNEPLKRLPLYQNKKVFAISIGLNELINELDIDPIKSYALYSGFYNPLFLGLNVNSNNCIKVENLIEPKKDYHLFKNEMKQFGFINNSIIESNSNSMVASLSKKVDTFIVYPTNSSFEKLRLAPDYFLRFDASRLDELIKNQKEILNEAKNFVNDGGALIYLVNTISKKESVSIINEFLQNNDDFVLEKDKQYLPFEKEETILYYAILRKKN